MPVIWNANGKPTCCGRVLCITFPVTECALCAREYVSTEIMHVYREAERTRRIVKENIFKMNHLVK